MQKIIAFFRLIRFQNLIIIAATQYLMRYAIIQSLLSNIYISDGQGIFHFPVLELQLTHFQFLSLVLSTIFLTAAGYVINDYFDTKTDLLNRPDRVIVGKIIPRRWAMFIHITLNVLGIGFGFYVSYSLGMTYLVFVFLIVTGLLWFYSTTYKRQFLVGNLLVAFLTALVPFMVVLFELPPVIKTYSALLNQYQVHLNYIVIWVGGFSFFAFMTTLVREILKDMEDFEGDRAYGRRSLPVVLGLKYSKMVVYALIILIIVALICVYFFYLRDTLTLLYILVGLILPLVYIMLKLSRAETQGDYHLVSSLSKLVMLLGLGYSIVARVIIVNQVSL